MGGGGVVLLLLRSIITYNKFYHFFFIVRVAAARPMPLQGLKDSQLRRELKMKNMWETQGESGYVTYVNFDSLGHKHYLHIVKPSSSCSAVRKKGGFFCSSSQIAKRIRRRNRKNVLAFIQCDKSDVNQIWQSDFSGMQTVRGSGQPRSRECRCVRVRAAQGDGEWWSWATWRKWERVTMRKRCREEERERARLREGKGARKAYASVCWNLMETWSTTHGQRMNSASSASTEQAWRGCAVITLISPTIKSMPRSRHWQGSRSRRYTAITVTLHEKSI